MGVSAAWEKQTSVFYGDCKVLTDLLTMTHPRLLDHFVS